MAEPQEKRKRTSDEEGANDRARKMAEAQGLKARYEQQLEKLDEEHEQDLAFFFGEKNVERKPKKEKKKKERDPKRPKKQTLGAFGFFVAKHRADFQQDASGRGGVLKLARQAWNGKSNEERQPFVEAYQKSQKQYKEQMQIYRDAQAYPPTGLAPGVKKLPEWIQLGCGDKPYNCAEKEATFAPDGVTPAEYPDFSKHNNFMTDNMTADVWEKLKDKKTSSGTTLAQCIKTGVDNKGHPHIKTCGIVACDEESYEVFKEIFDPIIDKRHVGHGPDAKQPTNLNIDELSNTDIDPAGKYVLTTRVRTGRSVRGFNLPPTIGFEERRNLEVLSVKGLMNMKGDLKGDYFPLNGSKSYPPKPDGMDEAKEEELRSAGNLFQEPDSTLLLASGMGRHWPDGRGVFHNDQKNLFVWVGEEDHLRIVSMQGQRSGPTPEGKNIKEVTARFIRACDEVQKVFKAEGKDFMHNDHLGWVLTCPSNLGTGLRAGTMVVLEKLSARSDFKKFLDKMRLQARGTGGVDSDSKGGTWDVSNSDRIGMGEVNLVNTLIEGAAKLVQWETMLQDGKDGEVEEIIKAL